MSCKQLSSQIVLLDIGNTSTKLALATEQKLLKISTISNQGLNYTRLASFLSPYMATADSLVCCSVVPDINKLLVKTLATAPHCQLKIIKQDIIVPLASVYQTPETLGQDRLVAAYAARSLFPEHALIIIDCGTALTLDLVVGEIFQGGFILASPIAQMQALSSAAQLPKLTLPAEIQSFSIGRTTTSCIIGGALYGTCAMLEGLCSRIESTLHEQVTIIGTGGLADILSRSGMHFNYIYKNLVLDGLRILAYQDNNAQEC